MPTPIAPATDEFVATRATEPPPSSPNNANASEPMLTDYLHTVIGATDS